MIALGILSFIFTCEMERCRKGEVRGIKACVGVSIPSRGYMHSDVIAENAEPKRKGCQCHCGSHMARAFGRLLDSFPALACPDSILP